MFLRLPGAVFVCALLLFSALAPAQELEPRAYANAPVGLNFLIAGYAYTDGGVIPDPTVPLTNAQFRIDGSVLAYARTFGFRGRSAKLDVIATHASLEGTADVAGVPVERNVTGFGDPRVRLSVNLWGGPARTLNEIRNFRQDLIVGASVQITAPWGQYDSSRLVNIGSNRWVVKPEVGLSKAIGAWTLELAGSALVFGDNDEFFGGSRRAQDPVYALQGSVIRSLPRGAWISVGGTRYAGGRSTVDDVRKKDLQENTRVGVIMALPIGTRNSLKLFANTGVSVRTGSDFDTVGFAWQYRWGGGLP